MISTVEEFKEAKDFVLQIKEKLLSEGVYINDNIKFGAMVETPAAALVSDELSKIADFLSIGTNDLIQYTMAIDRNDENLNYLYQPMNRAILKLIKLTIASAHENNKPCYICGEMASDEKAIPILIKFGVDELSVSENKILKTRKVVKKSKTY